MLGREELFFAFVRELLHLLFREDVAESHHDWPEFFFTSVCFDFGRQWLDPEGSRKRASARIGGLDAPAGWTRPEGGSVATLFCTANVSRQAGFFCFFFPLHPPNRSSARLCLTFGRLARSNKVLGGECNVQKGINPGSVKGE